MCARLLQPQLGAHTGQDHNQYGLGLNRQLYPQGFGGAHHGLPQGLDPARGIDQFFPQQAAGAGGGLGNLQSGGGQLPLQVPPCTDVLGAAQQSSDMAMAGLPK